MKLIRVKKVDKVVETDRLVAGACIVLMLVIMMVLATTCQAKEKESFYQEQWCNKRGGHLEYKLHDGTRVDCVWPIAGKGFAVEFDFAPKWAEAIGQSLHYARMTGLDAAIVLIMLDDKDKKYFQRAYWNIKHYDLPIALWVMWDKEE